jgi:hypothetical protein
MMMMICIATCNRAPAYMFRSEEQILGQRAGGRAVLVCLPKALLACGGKRSSMGNET